MDKRESGLAFHVHHKIPWEWCWDYEGRVAVIKQYKPRAEWKLRLRLLKIIPLEQLPEELLEAATEREKAWAKWEKADDKFSTVLKKYNPEIEALHKELCPNCP